MNKHDFTMAVKKALAKKEIKVTKDITEDILDAVFQTVFDSAMAGETVNLAGIGKIIIEDKPERVRRNPMTQEKVTVPACKGAKFRFCTKFKDELKKIV